MAWAQPLPRGAQGTGRALAAGEDAAGIWERLCEDRATSLAANSLSGPAGGISSAAATLTEALETEQLPHPPPPGALSLSSSASLLDALKPCSSPFASANPSLLRTPTGGPVGACTLTPSRPRAPLELSSGRCSLGHFQRAPTLLISHRHPSEKPREDRQTAVPHERVPGQGFREGWTCGEHSFINLWDSVLALSELR